MLYRTKPFSISDFSLSLKSPLTLRILKKMSDKWESQQKQLIIQKNEIVSWMTN